MSKQELISLLTDIGFVCTYTRYAGGMVDSEWINKIENSHVTFIFVQDKITNFRYNFNLSFINDVDKFRSMHLQPLRDKKLDLLLNTIN